MYYLPGTWALPHCLCLIARFSLLPCIAILITSHFQVTWLAHSNRLNPAPWGPPFLPDVSNVLSGSLLHCKPRSQHFSLLAFSEIYFLLLSLVLPCMVIPRHFSWYHFLGCQREDCMAQSPQVRRLQSVCACPFVSYAQLSWSLCW